MNELVIVCRHIARDSVC